MINSTKTPLHFYLHIILHLSSDFCVFNSLSQEKRRLFHVFSFSFTTFLYLNMQQKRLACNDLKQHYPHHQQGNKKEKKYSCCLSPSVKYIHPQAQYNMNMQKVQATF